MSHAIDVIKRFYELRPSGIIHVGANKGQEVEAYKASGVAPIAFIEPLEHPFRRLVKAIDGHAGFYPIQECCSSVSGKTLEFHVASNSGQSSSYLKPAVGLGELYPQITFESSVQVVTKTLDDVMAELQRDKGVEPTSFDYIAIDTQGSEHDVIMGATRTMQHIKFAWIEVSFGGLYEGDFDLYQTTELMRGLEFDLYYLVMRTKRWGDALFIRKGVVPTA